MNFHSCSRDPPLELMGDCSLGPTHLQFFQKFLRSAQSFV